MTEMGLFPERLEKISLKQFNVPRAELLACDDAHRANSPAANSSRFFSLAISALSLHARR